MAVRRWLTLSRNCCIALGMCGKRCCCRTLAIFRRSEVLCSMVRPSLPDMFIATSISPSWRCTCFRGKGLSMPPSTSSRPCHCTGWKNSGMDIDARIASNSEPLRNTTSSVVSRSEATNVRGTGNDSILQSGTISCSALITFVPFTSELPVMEKSVSWKISCRLIDRNHSLLSCSLPAQNMPAMIEPIEQPDTERIL